MNHFELTPGPSPGRAAWLLMATALLVAGCNGPLPGGGPGGGGSPPPPPSPPPGPPVDVSTVAMNDPGSTLPDGWEHGVFMEIYVRGYQDSDGDGIGDLQGLIQRLDYLHDLGVTGLWLMPIARSEDHDHGYAVSDYRSIETDYGTLADYDALLVAAHARGIGVTIDYVINHSASDNALFLNADLATSNPYRSWYLWQASQPQDWNVYGGNPWRQGSAGWYYAPFSTQMPDFNLLNANAFAYHQDNLRFWLNRGTDGFRFDAVGNLVENGPGAWEGQPQNYTLMHTVNQLVAGYQRRTMVCEAPIDPQGFGAATACGGSFAFDLRSRIVEAAGGATSSIQAVNDYFLTAPDTMRTFVSNHDSFAGARLWDQVGGDPAVYRLAAATYLLLPGTPFIYYGEEVGMSGAAALGGDHALRTPMSWTADTTTAGFTTATPFRALSDNVATQNVAAQLADGNSLHAFYQSVIALRNAHPALARGSYEAPFVSGQVMGHVRRFNGESLLVLINYGSGAATVDAGSLGANAQLSAVWPADGSTLSADGSGVAHVGVAAQSLRVFSVTP